MQALKGAAVTPIIRWRRLLRQSKPQHVDRGAEICLPQAGFVPQHRAASVGGERQAGPDFFAILQPYPGNATAFDNQINRFRFHPQAEI